MGGWVGGEVGGQTDKVFAVHSLQSPLLIPRVGVLGR